VRDDVRLARHGVDRLRDMGFAICLSELGRQRQFVGGTVEHRGFVSPFQQSSPDDWTRRPGVAQRRGRSFRCRGTVDQQALAAPTSDFVARMMIPADSRAVIASCDIPSRSDSS